MRNLLAPGVILGACAIAGMVAVQAGYPVLGAFLSDPHTGAVASEVLNGVLILAAGIARGVKGEAIAKVGE